MRAKLQKKINVLFPPLSFYFRFSTNLLKVFSKAQLQMNYLGCLIIQIKVESMEGRKSSDGISSLIILWIRVRIHILVAYHISYVIPALQPTLEEETMLGKIEEALIDVLNPPSCCPYPYPPIPAHPDKPRGIGEDWSTLRNILLSFFYNQGDIGLSPEPLGYNFQLPWCLLLWYVSAIIWELRILI